MSDAQDPADQTVIALTDPDFSAAELTALAAALGGPDLGGGAEVALFEEEFAGWLGRRYAVALASGPLALLCALRAAAIGPGDEVVLSSHGFRETGHAVALAGARPVFADIDYWSGCINPTKVEAAITGRTRAVIGSNVNGHPAAWSELRNLTDQSGLLLIEDSSEAIGSRYKGALVGSFGDCAIFDLSAPLALNCGQGGMVVTDDAALAAICRLHARRPLSARASVSATGVLPLDAGMGSLAAALGRVQLHRLPELLERRRLIAALYDIHMQSFEGIKPPYAAPEVSEQHWMLYLAHLGTRFSRSSRDAILDDLAGAGIDAVAYSSPLHLQRRYFEEGWRRGDLLVAEKIADRAIALPFHAHLRPEEIEFIVDTAKDSSLNVGAGAAIY